MTAPDATRRRIDAELRLQADPVLQECVRALVLAQAFLKHTKHEHALVMINDGPTIGEVIERALSRARGEA